MTILRVNLKTSQKPTDLDWEDFFNRVIDYVNAGIPVADLAKDASGKLAVDISGDAGTLNGKTASEIIGGDFPDIKKTLIDFISGGSPLVIYGGVATKNAVTANQLDITAIGVIQKVSSNGYIDRVDLGVLSKSTTLANETYYLDVAPSATDYSWGTAHPTGDYVPIATVTTDANANILAVTDVRPLEVKLLDGKDGKIIFTDANVGDRTIDQTLVPSTHTGTLTQLFSWIANRIKAITGATNWYSAPATTLASAKVHMDDRANIHNVTATQVGAYSKTESDANYYSKTTSDGRYAISDARKVSVSATAPATPATNDIWIDTSV
jgi:hypothetical protein